MQIAIENLGKVAPTVEKNYWDSNKSYDRLVFVRPSSTSYKTYISRKPVPAGTPLSNKEYWFLFSTLQESYENWTNSLQELLNQYYSTMQNAISFKGDIEVIPAGETRDVGFTFDCINASDTVMLDIYKDGVQVAHHNATSFPYHFTISNGGTGLYRCEADVNGIKYVGLWDIKESYNFWIGTGVDYNTVLANPSYKHVGASSLSGTYFLNPNENDYIFIICRSNVVPASITMSGFEVPLNIAEIITVGGVEYSVYQSANTYQQGSIEIKINDIQYDTDSYIAHLIEEILSLKTKAEGIEEEVRTIADEETITVTENNKVALKNRPMKKSATTGEVIQKGYVILKENDDFKTVVESYTEGHVIFEIDYAFDLDGESVTIPEGCTLKFEGGRVSNGIITLTDNCKVEGKATLSKIRFAAKEVTNISVEDVVIDAEKDSSAKFLLYFTYVDNIVVKDVTLANFKYNYSEDTHNCHMLHMEHCDNVLIDGLSNYGSAYPEGPRFVYCSHLKLNNVHLTDEGMTSGERIMTVIHFEYCEDVEMSNSYIYRTNVSSGSTINFTVNKGLIDNCWIHGGQGIDIGNEKEETFTSDWIEIRNCTFDGVKNHSIYAA
jgi:hypothetical protein